MSLAPRARRPWLPALLLVQLAWATAAHAQLYKEASPELNKRAEQRLRSLFVARSEQSTRALFGSSLLVCGPFLWRGLREAKQLQGVDATPSVFVSPKPTANGQLAFAEHGNGSTFTSRKSIDAFRRAFLARYPADSQATIRKLRLAEIRLFLATIPFPAEEPLFVIESRKHRFIVNLDKHLHILWIDDYLHLR
jgi:hypothetical protein